MGAPHRAYSTTTVAAASPHVTCTDKRRSAIVTVSSGSGPERVVEVYPTGGHSRSRSHRGHSSGGSTSLHSSSGSRSYSSASSDSWSQIEAIDDEDDGIEPLDSASQSRVRTARRHTTAEARPAPTRRHSSRRVTVERDQQPRRHSSRREHSSRHRRTESRRTPSDDSGSVASGYDDYPYSHHGAPQPPHAPYAPQRRYTQGPPAPGGYPPSVSTPSPFDAYAQHQALVAMPHQDAFGYPSQPNPFSPHGQQQNPFSPMSSASGAGGYFNTDPHAPPPHQPPHHHRPSAPGRPMSYAAPSHYPGSELMSQYPPSAHPAMNPYPPYGMPGYGQMPPPWGYQPPSHSVSPAPKEEKKEDSKISEQFKALEALIAKQEEVRLATEAARLKRVEAEVAEKERERLEAEAEKRRKEEIAAASKKAKEDAEQKAADAAKKAKDEHEAAVKKAKDAHEEAVKKAKDEHEKKLKEAETAKEEAEKKQKASEEEANKLKPPPDSTLAPIKFKDAVGRKFSFPFHLCKTWKGMELLIKQAFSHIDKLGDHVHAGHYDLTGPDGEIILPQVWDTMIKPDWDITMHLWPMEEEEKPHKHGKHDIVEVDGGMNPFAGIDLGLGMETMHIIDGHGGKKAGKKVKDPNKPKKNKAEIVLGPGPKMPPPPPPGFAPMPGGSGMGAYMPGDIVMVEDGKMKKPKAKAPKPSGFTGWMLGGRPPVRRRS